MLMEPVNALARWWPCACLKCVANQSQSTSILGITEEYFTQVSEVIEDRVTKKLFQEFSRTESRILGDLSKFLLSPQVRTLSATVPGTYRNNSFENREPTGDRSQSYLHPEMNFAARRTTNSTDFDPKETSHSPTAQ